MGTRVIVPASHGCVSVFSKSLNVGGERGQGTKKQREWEGTGIAKVTQDTSRNGVERRVLIEMVKSSEKAGNEAIFRVEEGWGHP